MSVYKRFALIFACFAYIALPLCFLALCALLWLYDPLQVWHKPYFRDISFFRDVRIQAKGIIKNYDFDSFILSTSMMENTLSKEAEQKLGGKWANISIGGFRFNERTIILKYMLTHTKPKNIIYSLDMGDWVANRTNDTKNFAFLYDDNELNDFKIYLNEKFVLCAIRFSKSSDCVGSKDLDNFISWLWIKDNGSNARFGGMQKWLENKEHEEIKDAIKKLSSMKTPTPYNPAPFSDSIKSNQKHITDNLLIFARQNPNTKFSIVIPIYSRLYYRLNDEDFPKAKVSLKWFVNKVANLKNVTIYGLDDLDYADEIANYRDLIHYKNDMNSMQIDAIANGTHILTPENIDEYLQTMENKIKAYDLAPLIRAIKEWEANSSKTK